MIGTYEVPMIHSTLLLDMRDTRVDQIQYFPVMDTYYAETDDILIFAWSVRMAGE